MWAILLIKPTSDSGTINNIYHNIQFVSVRATSFVLGMALGGYVQEKRQMRISLLVLMTILGVLLVLLSKHLVYGYFFFSLPVLFFMVYILNKCNNGLNRFASFMGKISLESYILNGTLPGMMISLFVFAGIPPMGNLFSYIAACVIGTMVGWVLHKFSDKLQRINLLSNENTY